MTRVVRSEAGETLIEVMMTVAIVSIAIVTIVTGIGASIRFSGMNRQSADAGLAVLVAAEAVRTQSGGSATCGTLTTSTYSAALTGLSLPAGWSSSNLSITSASCVTVNGVSLPKVVIAATSPDGSWTETVEVIRRSVA